MLLSVERLNCFYGEAIHALRDVSFGVEEGAIAAIIGANGAGKSTLMWTLVGLLRPASGTITFNGQPVTPVPHRAVASGIALVPERRRLFPNLSVRENLALGGYRRSDRAGIAKDEEYVFSLFPVLKERLAQYAGTLSGGQQQMLAMGRAMMARPRLLLLDEPSMGLAPRLVEEIFAYIRALKASGTTIFLVDQNAHAALSAADRGYVLETGRIVLSGSGAHLLNDEQVQEAYLGL
jgi:branched-chain amino acid transport system ATP-binding protein